MSLLLLLNEPGDVAEVTKAYVTVATSSVTVGLTTTLGTNLEVSDA